MKNNIKLEEYLEMEENISREFRAIVKEFTSSFGKSIFPKSGRALVQFVVKISWLMTAIVQESNANNYYASAILYRSLLEHYFKYQYIFCRCLKENSDEVGIEYYGNLRKKEDLSCLRGAIGFQKKNEPDKTAWNVGFSDISNNKIDEKAKNFEIKNILSYLHNFVGREEWLVGFKDYLSRQVPRYSDLSSFVHGGPFCEEYMRQYSENRQKAEEALDYFFKDSVDIHKSIVESTFLFASLLDDKYVDNYKRIKSINKKQSSL